MEAGEIVAEIETEKVLAEVIAPVAGILHHVAPPGTHLEVESLMGYVLEPGEAVPTQEAQKPATQAHTHVPELVAVDSLERRPVGGEPERQTAGSRAWRRPCGPHGFGPWRKDQRGRRPRGGRARIVVTEQASSEALRTMDVDELARRIRAHCIRMTARANASHIGSALSTADMLAVLYGRILRFDPADPDWPDRDRFILSKGHAGAALYAVLAEAGFFPVEWLDTFYADGSPLAGHATHHGVPGVEVSTGSLGHGLPIARGMALAGQRRRSPVSRVLHCSATASATRDRPGRPALFAPHHRLDNLVAIVDYNKIQSLGRVEEVLDLEPFADKWRAFGWAARGDRRPRPRRARSRVFERLPLEPGKPTVRPRPHGQGQGRELHGGRAPVALSRTRSTSCMDQALAEIGAGE